MAFCMVDYSMRSLHGQDLGRKILSGISIVIYSFWRPYYALAITSSSDIMAALFAPLKYSSAFPVF